MGAFPSEIVMINNRIAHCQSEIALAKACKASATTANNKQNWDRSIADWKRRLANAKADLANAKLRAKKKK